MEALARSYVWLPSIDKDLESAVHIDHAGPMSGNTFLVVVDIHSRWVEVGKVKSTDGHTTIRVLRKLFATHGVPRVIVSDNGPAFASSELAEFFHQNGVRHTFAAPYHPSYNGQVERFVRIFMEPSRP
jgi:transposase InsO family protein